MLYNKTRYGTGTPVIIIWGQSNAENGQTSGATPSSIYTAVQDARIWWMGSGVYTSPQLGTFPNLQWGVNNKWRAITGCGPELGLAYHLKNDYNISNLVILKYTLGGSCMVDNGVDTIAAGIWQLNPNSTRASGYLHCANMLFNFIQPAIAKLIANGEHPYIVGIHGSQGEGDTDNEYRGENWYAKATEMMQYWIDMLVEYNVGVQKAIITHTVLHDHSYNDWLATVQQAQQDYCDHFNGVLIKNVNSWSYNADNVHYTWQAQCDKHGKAIADIIGPRLVG